MEPIDCTETSVTNYQSTPQNIPAEQKIQDLNILNFIIITIIIIIIVECCKI